jgi:hypothetical protein
MSERIEARIHTQLREQRIGERAGYSQIAALSLARAEKGT